MLRLCNVSQFKIGVQWNSSFVKMMFWGVFVMIIIKINCADVCELLFIKTVILARLL